MIKKTALIITQVLYSTFSYAGSPGGLYLLVVPMNSAIGYKSSIDSYFNKHYGTDNPLSPSCQVKIGEKEMTVKTQVDLFYLTRKPEYITDTILSDTQTKNIGIDKLKYIIKNYKDDLVNGFDAIVFYESTGTKINFYSLSAIREKSKIAKSTITTIQLKEDEELGKALCQVIADLPLPPP